MVFSQTVKLQHLNTFFFYLWCVDHATSTDHYYRAYYLLGDSLQNTRYQSLSKYEQQGALQPQHYLFIVNGTLQRHCRCRRHLLFLLLLPHYYSNMSMTGVL